MSQILLNPDIASLVADNCKPDLRVTALLSPTCRMYRDIFPYTDNVQVMGFWLDHKAEFVHGHVLQTKQIYHLNEFKITYSKNNVWRISAESPGDHGPFEHLGFVVLGKRTATLVMNAIGWGNNHKDSFQGIQDLNTLYKCISAHTYLCHQTPMEPDPLPESVVHRHRHSFGWSLQRVFGLWKPFSKSYMTNDNGFIKHKNVEWELVEAF
jgi:hypothetical protein